MILLVFFLNLISGNKFTFIYQLFASHTKANRDYGEVFISSVNACRNSKDFLELYHD